MSNKNNKLFTLNFGGTVYQVRMEVSFYAQTDNLAIRLFAVNGENAELLMYLSVNTETECEMNCTYVDVDQDGLGIGAAKLTRWLVDNGIAVPTFIYGDFGCPEFCFDPKVLEKADPDGYKAYFSRQKAKELKFVCEDLEHLMLEYNAPFAMSRSCYPSMRILIILQSGWSRLGSSNLCYGCRKIQKYFVQRTAPASTCIGTML